MSIKFEICIDSVESGIAAEKGGAIRVELCDNLFETGTTPSAGMIEIVRKNVNIDLFVMIRPRGGDFLYTPYEIEIMKKDIEIAKELGADGVVFGVLNKDGEIDMKIMKELIELSRPMEINFHRAFDLTRDPYKSLEDLIKLGIDRVLTAGHENTVIEGIDTLKDLVEQAGEKISIMPGGNVTPRNIKKIIEAIGVSECHLSARKTIPSGMEFRKYGISMSRQIGLPDYERKIVDSNIVEDIIKNSK